MSFDGGVRKLKRSAGLILQVLRHASVAGQERIAANGSHLNVITVLQVPTDEAKVLLLPSEINVQLCVGCLSPYLSRLQSRAEARSARAPERIDGK
jgi:hypothetical protein